MTTQAKALRERWRQLSGDERKRLLGRFGVRAVTRIPEGEIPQAMRLIDAIEAARPVDDDGAPIDDPTSEQRAEGEARVAGQLRDLSDDMRSGLVLGAIEREPPPAQGVEVVKEVVDLLGVATGTRDDDGDGSKGRPTLAGLLSPERIKGMQSRLEGMVDGLKTFQARVDDGDDPRTAATGPRSSRGFRLLIDCDPDPRTPCVDLQTLVAPLLQREVRERGADVIADIERDADVVYARLAAEVAAAGVDDGAVVVLSTDEPGGAAAARVLRPFAAEVIQPRAALRRGT